MSDTLLSPPQIDPTSIFEHFRGAHGTELLTAAVAHFNVFGRLADSARTATELQRDLELQDRPAVVLFTALKAMGLVRENSSGQLELTELSAGHLVPGAAFDVGNYVGLAASSPGVLTMVDLLKTNRPLGSGDEGSGVGFIYRDGMKSQMEQSEAARHLTLSLAGRARNVAPYLAERLSLNGDEVLLDVGGGTGIYSFALLQRYPGLRIVVIDRPEVLRVAEEFAVEHGVAGQIELRPGDMFADELPASADVVLLSNILHDWDVPECRELVRRCAGVLRLGGRLLIHDVFLNDGLDGPLPIALYSASLFSLTEGRAYSAAEYRQWMSEAGLSASGEIVPTLVHCGVLEGRRV
jgi:ubiquinone/menaquinone biosynthesis C-methylase UbiE